MRKIPVILALMSVFGAHAQQQIVVDAAPVTWKVMHEAIFDSASFPETVTAEERLVAEKLWSKELSSRRRNESGFYPGFALIGSVHESGRNFVFSMFDAAGLNTCDPGQNGASASDIYVKCRMRVASWPAQATSTPQIVDLPGYCMISSTDDSNSRSEYRYDKKAQAVHFRTIQFGQLVPKCSRSLKLG